MTKFHKKLLVFLSVLVCTLCLCFGLAACNPSNDDNTNEDDGHTHNFAGAWLYDGAEGHYQLATCHPTVKSALEAHVDESEDGKCDVCDYPMTSEDDEHTHTYKDEWSFNEKKHWHDASCDHFIERSEYNDHDFVEGVCECGVKESEVKVYDLYRNSPEYDLEFVDWLDWLKDNGIISVEYTASGDGVYHYQDGTSEVRFLGERTVKVKAVVDGEPLADVWFMVAMYQTAEKGYYENKGTIALGMAKTDATGVAEITFRPVGGYSSEAIEYRIRIAEARDIAKAEKIDEESAKPIPNRYSVKGGNEGFEYKPYEVSENANSDDIAATIEFTRSNGWNAYNTIYLPYRRYWADQLNGTDIQEQGTTYNFTSSGYNLFDYFIFSPQQYDYKQGGTEEKNLQIVENAKIACSGVYTITFAVDRNATAELYFWDKGGVNLGAFHYTNDNGEPLDSLYLTEKSGENNFVTVKITPALGLRYYQFGIKTDIECNVTLTVERIGDIGPDGTFEWDSQTNKSQITVDIPQTETMTFDLNGVPEGLYVISVSKTREADAGFGRYYFWTDDDEQQFFGGEPNIWQDVYCSANGIIRITENTNYIYLQNTLAEYKNAKITLEKYELPTVTDGFTAVPVTPETYDISYTLPLTLSADNYNISVWIAGTVNGGEDIPLTVYIGEKQTQLTNPDIYENNYYTYTGTIEIGEQDNTISFRCSTEYSFTAGVKITLPHECKNVCPECNKCLTDCKEPECADKCAGHGGSEEPEDDIIADLGELTLSAGQTSNYIRIKNLQAKNYYLIAETDGTPASGVITAMIYGKATTPIECDMFTPITHVYKCVLAVQEDWFKNIVNVGDNLIQIQIKNASGEELHITKLQVVAYEEFTIEANKEYEIPAINGALAYCYIPISESLYGQKVRITVTYFEGTKDIRVHNDADDTYLKLQDTTSYIAEYVIPAGATKLAFRNMTSSQMQNIVVKIEIVED